ncbi:hypothetical protein KAT36_00595 [Candidatus Pacearchaeota archaeon]|nr:hypothetical protein [Candidatus Pacearchaeota archaeon]
MKRVTTSIKVNPELWKEVKIYCIRSGREISDYLEELIKKDQETHHYSKILKK